MERKSIGGFIAALRKANGMTQKELAERLNVSDKTVSRWERDDGAPDLSVIPVIAEIFDVTCDELLRGERKSPTERTYINEEAEPSPKAEKQRQRILAVSLSKYKTRSFIAMGISIAGIIAAMVINLGFLRAYIAFFISAVFYLAGIVCQAAFVNSAFLSVSDDSLSPGELGRYKKTVIRLAQWSVGLTVVLLGACLPLVIFTGGAYVGLSGYSWLEYGPAYGAIAFLLCCTVCYFLNSSFIKKGLYSLPEKEEQIFRKNHRLKGRCALILAAVILVTFAAHIAVISTWNVYALSDGTEFYDYESFAEYMEQDIPRMYYSNAPGTSATAPVADENAVYFDQYGNEISEEEALKMELRVYDGTEEGKVVCEYIPRNESVAHIRYSEKDGSLLPITVITYKELSVGQARLSIINTAFVVLYVLEALAVLLIYFKKRAK